MSKSSRLGCRDQRSEILHTADNSKFRPLMNLASRRAGPPDSSIFMRNSVRVTQARHLLRLSTVPGTLRTNRAPHVVQSSWPRDSDLQRRRTPRHRVASSKDLAQHMQGLIRLVLIGDVHRVWDAQQDAGALAFLRPDAAIFVGDFGEEEVRLVKDISELKVPKAIILGNHDAWGPLYRMEGHSLVQEQLQLLRDSHVGYSSKLFKAASGQPFSVIGARPFSDGNNTVDRCIKANYPIQTMGQSAQKILDEIKRQPADQPVIVIGHNGPTGLGKRRRDPCGKDFRPSEGDFGDQDLREALNAAAAQGRHVPLVAFGHMHQALHYRYGKGRRNMVQIDPATGTVYLNCAVVPREKRVPGSGERASHFVVASLKDGNLVEAENVWVKGSVAAGYEVWNSEQILTSTASSNGQLHRTAFQAFDSTWSKPVVLQPPPQQQQRHSTSEL